MALEAFVYKESGAEHEPKYYIAGYALKKLGYNVFFTSKRDVELMDPISDSDLFIGPQEYIDTALARLGIEGFDDTDYPKKLESFFKRNIVKTTLGEVRLHHGTNPSLRFIKPVRNKKLFEGHPISCFRDLIPTSGFSQDLEVWASEFKSFRAEYRYFVHKDNIIGSSHYSGTSRFVPDYNQVEQCVYQYTSDKNRPNSYCMDFGITDDLDTVLIELKRGLDYEPYSLSHLKYASMLEDRWFQLVGKR